MCPLILENQGKVRPPKSQGEEFVTGGVLSIEAAIEKELLVFGLSGRLDLNENRPFSRLGFAA
jgi:hypothetical protein